MADGPPIDDLAQSLVRLGELNIRICMMMAEAAATANGPDGGKRMPMAAEIPVTPAEVEAAATRIERDLLSDYELGFQCQLRLNFPRHRIMEMAKAALIAARGAR